MEADYRVFVRIDGQKIMAREDAQSPWVHVETVTNPEDAEWLATELEDDANKRREYVADPLS